MIDECTRVEFEQELLSMLRLISVKGVGPACSSNVFHQVGSFKKFFDDLDGYEGEISGLGKVLFERICGSETFSEERLQRWRAANVQLVPFFEEGYSHRLARLEAPPPLLFLQGDLALLNQAKTIAVVGTRSPDAHGQWLTRQVTKQFVELGYTIVSGGAEGVDTISHKTSLDCGGKTIAFLGGGLFKPYPRSNYGLFQEIRRNGLLVSEFLPETIPQKNQFPQRNRSIAASCDAVVVVQAPIKSGALNTAYHAEKLGVPVFTFPGRPNDRLSAGPHALIRNGAQLVESAEEIHLSLEQVSMPKQHELPFLQSSDNHHSSLLEPMQQSIIQICLEETDVETIAKQVSGSLPEVFHHLLLLELEGRLLNTGANRYLTIR